ncbi:MAG: response regulator [Maricaulis sp.]|uniref:sigma-54-dependent transcriptional regulator n=1 Tax=Maricaulis sp. TaxID=1486257 RepID=UPI00260953A8|nr:response regulator [Maricaulis sp.]MDM7982899.1 response regulator [Maricaulis sp.]
MAAKIILLEDDESLRKIVTRGLSSAGYEVRATGAIETARTWLQDGTADLLLTDVLLDGVNVFEHLPMLKRLQPDMPVIAMSAQTTAKTAIGASRVGVFEYLPKPFDLDDLSATVAAALKSAKKGFRPRERATESGLSGRSQEMQPSFKAIGMAARSRANVLITGEAGTGKRTAAETLFEARGVASEEIQVLTPSHAPKEIFDACQSASHHLWLRLDEWDERQLGAGLDGLDTGKALVVATFTPGKVELSSRLQARLGESRVDLPPLRQRADDIPALAQAFMTEFARRDGRTPLSLPANILDALQAYNWPGNSAQLRAVLSRLAVGSQSGAPSLDLVKEELSRASHDETAPTAADPFAALAQHMNARGITRQEGLDQLDKALILQALEAETGNQSKAAARIGVNRNTLARRMAELGLR